jgi:hypothetical protein
LKKAMKLSSALLLFLPLAVPSARALPVAIAQARDAQARDELSERRERWQRRSAEERHTLRERFETLRGLPPEKRRLLVERARRLRAYEERLRRSELREELSESPPEERPGILRAHVRERLHDASRRWRERLSGPELEELRRAPPAERDGILERLVQRERERRSAAGIRWLGAELELAPDEIERLCALPPEERVEAFLDLRRRVFRRRVELFGPPPGVSPEEWRGMDALPDRPFFERLRERWHPPRPAEGGERGHGRRPPRPGERGRERGAERRAL